MFNKEYVDGLISKNKCGILYKLMKENIYEWSKNNYKYVFNNIMKNNKCDFLISIKDNITVISELFNNELSPSYKHKYKIFARKMSFEMYKYAFNNGKIALYHKKRNRKYVNKIDYDECRGYHKNKNLEIIKYLFSDITQRFLIHQDLLYGNNVNVSYFNGRFISSNFYVPFNHGDIKTNLYLFCNPRIITMIAGYDNNEYVDNEEYKHHYRNNKYYKRDYLFDNFDLIDTDDCEFYSYTRRYSMILTNIDDFIFALNKIQEYHDINYFAKSLINTIKWSPNYDFECEHIDILKYILRDDLLSSYMELEHIRRIIEDYDHKCRSILFNINEISVHTLKLLAKITIKYYTYY